jgi:hypothetical protein
MASADDDKQPPAAPQEETPATPNAEFIADCLRREGDWLELLSATFAAYQMTLSPRWGQVLRIDFTTNSKADEILQNRLIFWKKDGGAIHRTILMGEDWPPLDGQDTEVISLLEKSLPRRDGSTEHARRRLQKRLGALIKAARDELPPETFDFPPLAPKDERPAPSDPAFAAERKAEVEQMCGGPVEWVCELFSVSDQWGRLWRADYIETQSERRRGPYRIMVWKRDDGVWRTYLSCKSGGENPLALE